MSQQFIPLSVPNFSGNEKQYVNEAVISEWVSTGGSKVSEFEEKIAEYTHMPPGRGLQQWYLRPASGHAHGGRGPRR